jgi:hypothetical protein
MRASFRYRIQIEDSDICVHRNLKPRHDRAHFPIGFQHRENDEYEKTDS